MKDNNDFMFGSVLNDIANDGYKSFENIMNLLYGAKENNSNSEPKNDEKPLNGVKNWWDIQPNG